MFTQALIGKVRGEWPTATEIGSRYRLANELGVTPRELFQMALLAGLRVCEQCDSSKDHVVAVLTRRYGGDCVHVCCDGEDASALARHLVSETSDPFDDYLFYEGRRSVSVLAVADTFVVDADGALR